MQPLKGWSPGFIRSKPFEPPEGGTPNQPRFMESLLWFVSMDGTPHVGQIFPSGGPQTGDSKAARTRRLESLRCEPAPVPGCNARAKFGGCLSRGPEVSRSRIGTANP